MGTDTATREITMSSEELLDYQFDVLGHTDGFTELRTIHNGKQIFCGSKEEFIESSLGLLGFNAYVGLNPRSCASGNSDSIELLTCLAIDIDPIRVKNTPSTDEQHELALELGRKIGRELGYGPIVSSGSGCHVYVPLVPIKVTNQKALTDSLKKWSDAIKENYETKELKIDSIFDLPRIIRLWGSLNTKSNRLCAPIDPHGEIKRQNIAFSQV